MQGPVPSSSSPRQALGLAVGLAGLAVAVTACACGPLMIALPALAGEGAPDGLTIQQALTLAVLGGGLGLSLAVAGWGVWRGRPSRPFHPRRTWVLWAVLFPLLVSGLLISLLDLAPAYLLPPINALTMTLLPMLILDAVGRALEGKGGTWRDVIGGLAGGALLGTGLAMVVEVGLVVVLAMGALALGLLPGGPEGLGSLGERLSDPTLLYDPQALLDLLTPGVVLVALAFVSVATPLVEETTKTLGMALVGTWLRPRPARAFLLGVASGAGFALAENLMNGAVGGVLWGPGILSRLAATLMHCATGGLMGWGWGELWAGRRPWRLALAFIGAVGVHGMWNGLAVGAAISGLAAAGGANGPVRTGIAGLTTLLLTGTLVLLAAAALAGMLWAGWVLGRGEKAV
ncbi:MAG TPA: PrsW family intramembrane metalloprotease [Anaerolineales bacterium]|nr:PrsW family intramembrane metalloprotease [Anaerolineae bacterium]HIQ01244.1 PrsW family intramembrane metalloprotease [Anaerolineales bacterium]